MQPKMLRLLALSISAGADFDAGEAFATRFLPAAADLESPGGRPTQQIVQVIAEWRISRVRRPGKSSSKNQCGELPS